MFSPSRPKCSNIGPFHTSCSLNYVLVIFHQLPLELMLRPSAHRCVAIFSLLHAARRTDDRENESCSFIFTIFTVKYSTPGLGTSELRTVADSRSKFNQSIALAKQLSRFLVPGPSQCFKPAHLRLHPRSDIQLPDPATPTLPPHKNTIEIFGVLLTLS